MRKISDSEILSLRELLQMETNALAKARVSQAAIGDDDLKKAAESGILAMEGRIKAMQQFINENQILGTEEVR
jgi:hypothetical protein